MSIEIPIIYTFDQSSCIIVEVTPVRNQQRVSVQDENPSPATECTEANAGSTESFPKKVIKEKAALARKSRLQTLRSRKVAKVTLL